MTIYLDRLSDTLIELRSDEKTQKKSFNINFMAVLKLSLNHKSKLDKFKINYNSSFGGFYLMKVVVRKLS